jgi:hypothetical protein
MHGSSPLLRDGSQIHLSIGIFTKHQVKTMAYQDIVPLVGARRRDLLAEALGALDVKLSDVNLAALARALPPGAAAGGRYPASALAYLDSEKRGYRLPASASSLVFTFRTVRFGSKGDLADRFNDVCFDTESGHPRTLLVSEVPSQAVNQPRSGLHSFPT